VSQPDPAPAPPASAATPKFNAAQRWNVVWVVPILALLVGVWLVYHNITSKGPLVRVTFETAEGIVTGKTEVRCRNVKVGFVDDVELSNDLRYVTVSLRMDPEAAKLLRGNAAFWVVKPRVSAGDVSGLGTFLTGAFIELDPGPDYGENKPRTEYKGFERPPATSLSVPGRRLVLQADEAGSLIPGSPIYYRGFEVGRIENRVLSKDGITISYDAFVREEYAWLVTRNTRFWNTSGIDVTAGADGFRLRTPSFQAMVSGGAEFRVPDRMPPGDEVKDGAVFTLHPNYDDAIKSTFAPSAEFLLLFDQSVRGLTEGAPVEFRGIPIGRVARISFDLNSIPGDRRIPVLVAIDPSLLRKEASDRIKDPNSGFLEEAVGRGFRASLKTGSLLTGAMYVDMDYHPDAAYAEMSITGNLRTIPTISSGFAQMEAKLTAILDKIQALPLDETMTKFATAADEAGKTVAEARGALKEIEGAAAAARATLEDPQFRDLPGDLKKTLGELEKSVASVGPDGAIQGDLLRTLDELRHSLRSFKSLTNSIGEKPNSLLFGKDSSGNPIPKAPKRK